MEFINSKTIRLDKAENDLDRFAVDFSTIIEKHTKHVIISGYVAILFGRNRASEDIDVFVEGFQDFEKFYREIHEKGYWILNHDNSKDAHSMIKDGLAIRIARKNQWLPNFEIKMPKRDTDFYSLQNRITVLMKSGKLLIGPLELGIAFKLFLSSEKDIEDARFLYKLFQDRLDIGNLEHFAKNLKVLSLYEKYLL
ncbi:MAG: hypothetical protein HYX24_05570 [Candidatus Aenigmarchaeota archaeon]|nr:hypothetical protein [Candidatus Aenigmarchaeota archaeon]